MVEAYQGLGGEPGPEAESGDAGMNEMVVWIQCTPQGKPIFATASSNRLESRSLLRLYLYPGEDISWTEIRKEGSTEKRFRITEMPEEE